MGERKGIMLSLDEDIYIKAKEKAEVQGRNISWVVEQALKRFLEFGA